MNKKRKQMIAENEVSELYSFSLGGYEQKVLIEGRKKDFPIVITLHGGPGSPFPFSVGCRGLFPDFTNRFIMVYWDQLGCGINNCKLGPDIQIDTFVDMTVDLVHEVRKLFPDNSVYLFGISWGTMLALKTSARLKDEIAGVVAAGQVVKNLLFNEEVYQTLEKSGIPEKKMERIKAISPENFDSKDMSFFTGCIRKYTNGYQNRNEKAVSLGPILKGFITSPDYSFRDVKAVMINGYGECQHLWRELPKIDLTELLVNVEVPYFIVQGDTDIVTSTAQIQALTAGTDNPMLHLKIIPDSGHIPGIKGMEEILKTLEGAASSCQK